MLAAWLEPRSSQLTMRIRASGGWPSRSARVGAEVLMAGQPRPGPGLVPEDRGCSGGVALGGQAHAPPGRRLLERPAGSLDAAAAGLPGGLVQPPAPGAGVPAWYREGKLLFHGRNSEGRV